MEHSRLTIFVLITLALSFVRNTSSKNVECWFTEASYWSVFDKPYACVAYDFRADENVKEIITNVTTGTTGLLREGLTYDDVIVLDIRGFCNFIPTGFDKFFKNILGFSVYNTQTFTVSSDDLKQFPKLRELWIYSNELEYLPSNLLEHNPDMEYIHFNSNKIKSIGSEFFSKVPKLYGAVFTGNVCIDRSAGDAKKLESLKKEIKKKCSSSSSGDDSKKFSSLKIDLLLLKIAKLKKEIKDLKDESKNHCKNSDD